MTAQEKNALRKKWRKWLKRVGQDLGSLLTGHDIFAEIQQIVAANKKVQTPDLYFLWIKDNYAARVTIGIRRLIDADNRSISLTRLIKDISNNREALPRDYYISSYRKWMKDAGFADRDFDQFANRGKKYVSTYKLSRDIKRLASETRLMKKFADTWIAHCDLNQKNKVRRIPTFKDVSKTLESLDAVYCRYHLLLTRGGMTTRKPSLQFDWKKPLRHAWIAPTHNLS